MASGTYTYRTHTHIHIPPPSVQQLCAVTATPIQRSSWACGCMFCGRVFASSVFRRDDLTRLFTPSSALWCAADWMQTHPHTSLMTFETLPASMGRCSSTHSHIAAGQQRRHLDQSLPRETGQGSARLAAPPCQARRLEARRHLIQPLVRWPAPFTGRCLFSRGAVACRAQPTASLRAERLYMHFWGSSALYSAENLRLLMTLKLRAKQCIAMHAAQGLKGVVQQCIAICIMHAACSMPQSEGYALWLIRSVIEAGFLGVFQAANANAVVGHGP